MKANKLMKALAASAMSLALVAGMTAMPAMATEAAGGVKFTKAINMAAAADGTVPSATYSYTVRAGEAKAATATSPAIKAGLGTPTIANVVFTPKDAVSDSKVSKDVTVNFSGITFPTAGIYRYVITETNPTVAGLETGDANTIYLDVYVTNVAGACAITYYQMSTSDAAPTYAQDNNKTPTYTAKFTEDTDTYTTYTLTVTKNVEGAMADMTQKFSIDVDFTGLSEGTKVKVDGVQTADGASADGALSVNKSLGDDESITITGVPANAVYTVVEQLSSNEAYTVTYKIDGADSAVDATYANTNNGEYTTANQQDMDANNHTVTVINTKNAVNPTGIILNVAPYALMVVIALAGVVVFLRKRVED
ncbi:MAG TPA: hypothetical protein IAC27_04770 [Candidatus Enterenecus avicola]|nr:hypothetical protein [Candidatus Enterenecus avicola]